MIYGDLRLRDRLWRALFGAVLGGLAGFLLMLRRDMFRSSGPHSLLLPATAVGAVIGAYLAFRVKRIV